MLGVTTDSRVKDLVVHIAARDLAAGLDTINSLMADGLDLMQFNRGLVEFLRNMLLAKSGAEASVDLAADDLAEVKQLADRMAMDDVVRALKLFGQIDLRSRDYSSLPLELALVESILPKERESKAAPPARQPTAPKKAETAPAKPPAPVSEPAAEKKDVTPTEAAPARAAAPIPDVVEPEEPKGPGVPSAVQPDLERVKSQWSDFVNTLRGVGSSGSLDAFLRSACEPEAVEGDTLVLAFYHDFHKKKIEDTKYTRMVERKLAEKFGSPNKIRCVLKTKEVKPKRKVEDIPLVKAALEHGARITSVVEDSSMTEGEEKR
jgi:DNA polymerase III gamma/tau subunit